MEAGWIAHFEVIRGIYLKLNSEILVQYENYDFSLKSFQVS